MHHTAHTVHAQVLQALKNCRSQVKWLLEACEAGSTFDEALADTAFNALQQEVSVLVGQRLAPDSVEKNAASACGYYRQGLPSPARFHLRQLDAQLRRELEARDAA